MKKRLLSAVLALVLCAYPAMAADFGTLTISSDREVIDDSVLYELAAADEPSTLTLRTPDGETGSLTFDGTKYHLQPCGQTNEFTYSVLFSADGENAYGLPYTEWFMSNSDIGQHIFDPVTEWDARHICSMPRWLEHRIPPPLIDRVEDILPAIRTHAVAGAQRDGEGEVIAKM